MAVSEIEQATAVLRRGGVVAHATEGVWGLACDSAKRYFGQENIRHQAKRKGRRDLF